MFNCCGMPFLLGSGENGRHSPPLALSPPASVPPSGRTRVVQPVPSHGLVGSHVWCPDILCFITKGLCVDYSSKGFAKF